MWVAYALAALTGYLLGSIPTGYLVGRAKGVDVRQHGSGNIGATNVLRVLGKKPGIFVFVCDVLKGWLAVTLANKLFGVAAADPGAVSGGTSSPQFAGILAAIACILGHNFPVWLGFKGGKGIATTTGVLLGLMPLAVLVGAAVWAIAFFTLRYVSVASLLAAATLPVVVGLLWKIGRADGALFAFSLLAAALAWWRHRTNIQRLLAGTESRFQKKAKPSSKVEGGDLRAPLDAPQAPD